MRSGRVIVVLGMHRSGTSAVTRALEALGVDLGASLIPGIPGNNDKGFFEDRDINRLNEDLLTEVGATWHSLSLIPAASLAPELVDPFFRRAVGILQDRIGSRPFGLKDPRMSRLLPFWQTVFKYLNLDVSYVLAIRHPSSVARSLSARDGFDLRKSHYLWLQHVLSAVRDSADLGILVVDYDEMIGAPLTQLRRLAARLQLRFAETDGAVKEYVESFLDASLRHFWHDLADTVDDGLPSDVVDAYRLLVKLGHDELGSDGTGAVVTRFAEMAQGLERLGSLIDYATDRDCEATILASKVLTLDRHIAEEESLLATTRQELDSRMQAQLATKAECDQRIEALSLDLALRDHRVTLLVRELDQHREKIGDLCADLQEREKHVVGLKQELSLAGAQVAELEQLLADRGQQIRDIKAALAQTEGVMDKLTEEQLAERRHGSELSRRLEAAYVENNRLAEMVAAMTASLSWRLTCGLRLVGKHGLRLIDGVKVVRHAVTLGGGYRKTVLLSIRVLMNDGWSGIAWRTRNANALRLQSGSGIQTGSSMLHEQSVARIPESHYYIPYVAHGSIERQAAKIICFYLPQFHPIPENDQWWGEGFTEWTNVRPAIPQFSGHYQPHVPDGRLGYYDLLDPGIQAEQVSLAKNYGIGGFCFYVYWFAGRRLLEAPVERYLDDPTLDLPFCLCWANENWSRRWDGLDHEVLIAQQHSPADDIAFIAHISSYLRDTRYIRVNGKPLVVVYRPALLPSARETSDRWRSWCRENGIGEIYLAYTQSFEKADPSEYGFDAAIEFPPNNSGVPDITASIKGLREDFVGKVYDWQTLVDRSRNYPAPTSMLFRGVCPSWDNTARRGSAGTVLLNSSPQLYSEWLRNAIVDTVARIPEPSDRLVFVNAWNEWAEGAHLEPDQRYGYAWLEASRSALLVASGADSPSGINIWQNETQVRHETVYRTRHETLATLFGSRPDPDRYCFLAEYPALLQIARRRGLSLLIDEGVPTCVVERKRVKLEEPRALAALAPLIFSDGRPYCFVVLQYNAVESTEKCVAALTALNSAGQDVHIIVVDNGSRPDVVERTRSTMVGIRGVTVLFSDSNLGFSGGNNIGYRYARDTLHARFVVMLNNDVVVEQRDFIARSLKLFSDWSYSIAGPDVQIPDGRRENPWNDYIYSIDEWRDFGAIREREREAYLSSGEASFTKIGRATPSCSIRLNPILQGAAIIVSPIYLEDHEVLFDDRLFLYGEEFLLAIDCLGTGHLCLYASEMAVRHIEGVTTASLTPHEKFMKGYDSAIMAIRLGAMRLDYQIRARAGKPDTVNASSLTEVLGMPGRKILVDLLFCQPGYHGGGEYGKAVFKKLAEDMLVYGGYQLWVALDPDLFIDPWVLQVCQKDAINVIGVRTFDDITRLVNSDQFDAFFAPAIAVYTGYEYMGQVGDCLPFTCKKTRVIGTLHDIRDYQMARDHRRILGFRRALGCGDERAMTDPEAEIANENCRADALHEMYRAIVEDPVVFRIVTISEYSRRSIVSEIARPSRPMEVLMSPMKPRPAPEPIPEELLVHPVNNYALVIQAGRKEKNGAAAVAAFDELFDAREANGAESLRVVLTGVTSVRDVLPRIRNENRFVVVGHLAPAQFEFLLSRARFLVYSSLNEGLGYPPIEAMSLGVPSLVSNITAIPEVCGDAVVYCDPYNIESIKAGIRTILRSPPSLEVIRKRFDAISLRQNKDLARLSELISGIQRLIH